MELDAYARTWRAHEATRRADAEARARDAVARLPHAVRALVEEFAATRVVLFGSLRRGRLHERSDVDLAVEGIPVERYFAAVARVSEILGRNVDLVPTETASPEILTRIGADGEVLHG